jgi:5-methylcytosine-specific restriction endonuclease McrA
MSKDNGVKAVNYSRNRKYKNSGRKIYHRRGYIKIEEWLRLKAKYGHSCLCCGKEEPTVKVTMDHIVPVSLGGASTIDNIQPLCETCNTLKDNKIIDYRDNYE